MRIQSIRNKNTLRNKNPKQVKTKKRKAIATIEINITMDTAYDNLKL